MPRHPFVALFVASTLAAACDRKSDPPQAAPPQAAEPAAAPAYAELPAYKWSHRDTLLAEAERQLVHFQNELTILTAEAQTRGGDAGARFLESKAALESELRGLALRLGDVRLATEATWDEVSGSYRRSTSTLIEAIVDAHSRFAAAAEADPKAPN